MNDGRLTLSGPLGQIGGVGRNQRLAGSSLTNTRSLVANDMPNNTEAGATEHEM